MNGHHYPCYYLLVDGGQSLCKLYINYERKWLLTQSFEDGDGTNEIQSLHNNYGLKNDLIKLGLSMGTNIHDEKKESSTTTHATTSSNCKNHLQLIVFSTLSCIEQVTLVAMNVHSIYSHKIHITVCNLFATNHPTNGLLPCRSC